MNAVTGLVERKDDLDRVLSGLQETAFSPRSISVLGNTYALGEQANHPA